MAIKKIKRGGITATGLVITIMIIMGLFYGLYNYVDFNATEANLTIDSRYSESYGNLSEAQSSLDTNIRDIKSSAEGIVEADNVAQVAWNGLKGLGNTLNLFLSLLTTSLKVMTSFLGFSIEFMPPWSISLVSIAITAILVFLVVKIFKGEPNV